MTKDMPNKFRDVIFSEKQNYTPTIVVFAFNLNSNAHRETGYNICDSSPI